MIAPNTNRNVGSLHVDVLLLTGKDALLNWLPRRWKVRMIGRKLARHHGLKTDPKFGQFTFTVDGQTYTLTTAKGHAVTF